MGHIKPQAQHPAMAACAYITRAPFRSLSSRPGKGSATSVSGGSSRNCTHRRKYYTQQCPGSKLSINAVLAKSDNDLPPSGLNGKALEFPSKDDFPTRASVLASIPAECFQKETIRSLFFAALSTGMTIGCGILAYLYIPLKLTFWPAWLAYALVTGTVWTGMWVIAHECGHNAFSNNKLIQDTVGYIFHSLLLVPYFSWQHSHAVPHQFTNHITKGETHVPFVIGGRAGVELPGGEHMMTAAKWMGKKAHGVLQVV